MSLFTTDNDDTKDCLKSHQDIILDGIIKIHLIYYHLTIYHLRIYFNHPCTY